MFRANLVLIIRRVNCIDTTSGICHPVSLTVSCAGQKGTFGPAKSEMRQGIGIFEPVHTYQWKKKL